MWLSCCGNSVTPCFSKRLSWQMPKGILCLSVTCTHAFSTPGKPQPSLRAQSLPEPPLLLLLIVTKYEDQHTPANSTLSWPLPPA